MTRDAPAGKWIQQCRLTGTVDQDLDLPAFLSTLTMSLPESASETDSDTTSR